MVEFEPENTDSRNPCQRKTLDKDCGCLSAIDKAERQGFEPWVPLRVLRFSRPVWIRRNDQPGKELRNHANAEVPVWVPSPPGVFFGAVITPDLTRTLEARNGLPESILWR